MPRNSKVGYFSICVELVMATAPPKEAVLGGLHIVALCSAMRLCQLIYSGLVFLSAASGPGIYRMLP